MLGAMWQKFDRDWGWNLARLLAYTSLMALFAVVGLDLVVLALVMRVVSPGTQLTLATQIAHLLPDRITGNAVLAFTRSLQATPTLILLLALPITFWYGTRFLVVLESCLCVIFRRRQRPFLAQNRAALLLLLLFAVLVPVLAFSATFEPYVGLPTARHLTPTAGLWISDRTVLAPIGVAAGLAANTLFLLVAYTRLTPGGVSLRMAWPGALLGAALAQGYLLFFPFYARNVLRPSQFGSVAGIVLMALVFFFAYGLFIVLGAQVGAWRAGYRARAQGIPDLVAAEDPLAGDALGGPHLPRLLPGRWPRRALPPPSEAASGAQLAPPEPGLR